jgi:hypothetical protein
MRKSGAEYDCTFGVVAIHNAAHQNAVLRAEISELQTLLQKARDELAQLIREEMIREEMHDDDSK